MAVFATDEAAEDVSPLDPRNLFNRHRCRFGGGDWRLQVDAAVRPSGVVMLEVPRQDPFEVAA
jgi:hypothetical protein